MNAVTINKAPKVLLGSYSSALNNKPNKGLFASNLFQDSANHRSGWSPDASCLLMFLNNITVPSLLGDALFSVSVDGLSLIVLFYEPGFTRPQFVRRFVGSRFWRVGAITRVGER